MAIELFVPGRLCLFGEHSDWAGKYRAMNSSIVVGMSIVSGIDQGIYAVVEKSTSFRMTSEAKELADCWEDFECAMDLTLMKEKAQSDSFFKYAAGVASYMLEWYNVGGVHVHITKMDMPIKSGLSSSAAICVLICRAFNRLYGLNLSTMGEMNIAYWGELRTSSRCGRLDQACAFGGSPVLMTFDAEDINVQKLTVGKPLYWVFANLNSSKDTIRILSDLNKAYPFASNAMEEKEHRALGSINREIVQRAVELIRDGDAEELGKLMSYAQEVFDTMIAPNCPSQLTAPKLHRFIEDTTVKDLAYGAKGVGSQGDGSIQFLAKDEPSQVKLLDYLSYRGLTPYKFTIQPTHKVTKAIIPVAGFGTRLYPATKLLKKEFFPVIDTDGMAKPLILVLLEECLSAGIEQICIVLGSEEEREQYRSFFEMELPESHLAKLSIEKAQYEKHITTIGAKLQYVYQTEKNGFGDAVYRCAQFAGEDPVLLLLGDTIYRSLTDKSCALQLVQAYEKYGKTMVTLCQVPLRNVGNYGIISGDWADPQETVMNVKQLCEKPTIDFAEENLSVVSAKTRDKRYFSVFGQYILTKDVFKELEQNVLNERFSKRGEIELTDALCQVLSKTGIIGLRPEGKMYDIGIPSEYRDTICGF